MRKKTLCQVPQASLAKPPEPPISRAAALRAAGLGLAYFLALGGHHAIWPGNIDWLMRNDWSQHYLGWAFFRATPWQWPLGTIEGLGHPVGTSVALTDANPLLALPFRLMSPWLPQPFQYIGLFMALCFMLQGYCGARLGQILGARARTSVYVGCLFVLTPALLHRMDHDTLMGQWLIVASIATAFARPNKRTLTPWLARAYGTAIVAALVHPYLLAMALPILLVALVAQVRSGTALTTSWAALWLGATVLSLALIAWSLGYFKTQADWGTDGFGFFSADPLAFFNPQGWSRLLPNLHVHRGQVYEGFGYLGLGLMGLLVLGLAAYGCGRKRFSDAFLGYGLMCVAACSLVFSWGSSITWHGVPTVDATWIYAPVAHFCAMFRASGRFVWVPTYLAMAAALRALLQSGMFSRSTLDRWLVALIALQLVDVEPVGVRERLTQDPKVAMTDPLWQKASQDYDHIVMVPPHFPTSHVNCNPKGYREKAEMPPGLLAASLGMSINSAYLSRSDARAIKNYCDVLGTQLSRGFTDARTLYFVHPHYLPLMQREGMNMACFKADNVFACLRGDRPTSLLQAVRVSGRAL